MRLTRKLTAAVVAAGLGAGAALGIAQAGADDPAPLWQPTTTDAAVPATTDMTAAYAVLRTARVSPAPDDGEVQAMAARSDIGADADGARAVGSTASGPIWLVPVNGGLCLSLEDTADTALGTACEGGDDVIARGTTIGDGTHIYGIAPDGVGAVTVTPKGGSETVVGVSAGGVYTLPSEDATISVDGPGGLAEFTVEG